MSYTLYGWEGNPRVRTCQVVAQFEGLNLKLDEVNNIKKVNVEPYLQKFPHSLGKIPGLEAPGGVKITETLAVTNYLASVESRANLLGRSKQENAEVLQWSSLVNTELHPLGGQWVLPLLPEPMIPYNKAAVTQAEQKYVAYLDVLEKILHTRTFLVGHRITLADIFLTSNLVRPFAKVLDPAFRKSHPNLTRYYLTVANQPAFIAVTGGAPQLAEKKLEFTPPPKQPKQPAAAAAAAPKAEKKAAKKEDDDEEPAAPAEPKVKHPCETLGPAKSFPFDEWKRQYSNLEFGKAMTWLSEHLDETEYSFWRVSYKYDDELTQVFMSANLIGGFHSRLEASRKYLFGSAGVYGKANASKIQGAYMIRGQEWKPVFDVAPDWESYNFEKIDFKKDQDYIRGCWNWDNTYDGLDYADGKVFK